MKKQTDILPCPICGGDAGFTKSDWLMWRRTATIKCKTIWCGLSLTQKSKSLAIEIWNTRNNNKQKEKCNGSN
jgi:hypothetical protein